MTSIQRQKASAADAVRSSARTRILVTGATGKIGPHVVNELLARGYQVRAVTSRPVAAAAASDRIESSDRLEWCHFDFQESLDFDSLVRECSAVIHLGAETDVEDRMPRSNVEATRALAEASERASIRVFCYTSSMAVYGSSRRRRVLEDSPVLTTDRDLRSEYWANEKLRCYGRTKLQGEFAISSVAQKVEYIILRPTAVIDIQDLMRLRGWSKTKKCVKGSEHPHQIYVRDVVDVILWFMERSLGRDQPLAAVTAFNLSDGDTPIKTFSQVFKSAYAFSGDRRWRANLIFPWPVQWLMAMGQFRRVLLRQPRGRMLISGDKLREEGFTFRFGIPYAVAVFCQGLASSGASVVKDVGSVNSAHYAPAESPSDAASRPRSS